MSKWLKLDTSSISQRYATETARFDCKRSSHYFVFLLWKKSKHVEPELQLYYKGRSGEKTRLYREGMERQYNKVGEPMTLSQAGELWKGLIIEAMSSLARSTDTLRRRYRSGMARLSATATP